MITMNNVNRICAKLFFTLQLSKICLFSRIPKQFNCYYNRKLKDERGNIRN